VQVDILQRSAAIFPLKNPGIVSVPLAFLVGIAVSLLAPNKEDATRFGAIQRKMLLGKAAEPAE
jgi:cation/acetate symporter